MTLDKPLTDETRENVADSKEQEPILLTVNSKVLEVLAEEQLDINMLFILFALDRDRIDLLDKYDENNEKRKVLLLEYQHLEVRGYVSQSDSESNVLYDITKKGQDLVQICSLHFEEPEEKESPSDLKKLAEEYLEIFPKIKLPSGKYARVALPEIEKKLKIFKRTYKPSFKKYYGFVLTDEDILQATRAYVKRYAATRYQFMVTSSYFIQKNEKSALADEILAMKQGLASNTDKFEKQL